MYRKTKLFGLALFATFALIACGGGDDTGTGDGGTDGGGGGPCATDSDCSNTESCSSGTCTSKCSGVICNTGQVCEPTTGSCVSNQSCTVDADCNDQTLRCSSGSCVSKCDGVVCNTGETCDPTTGVCGGGAVNCVADADCPQGDICDSATSTCEGGTFQSCSPTDACATGYDCLAAGTSGSVCFQACTTTTDCSLDSRCLDAQFGPLANHCYFNLCEPGGDPTQGVQDAPYAGACDAAATGDGTCIGPLDDGNGGGVGICLGGGTAAPGDPCSTEADWNAADGCAGGICLTSAQGATTGTCGAFCALFDGNDCADIGTTPQSCTGAWGQMGVCFAQDPAPGALGDACTATQGGALVCAEDTACAPVDLQQGATQCLGYCDPGATTGQPGACATGTCTVFDPQNNPFLGLCANP